VGLVILLLTGTPGQQGWTASVASNSDIAAERLCRGFWQYSHQRPFHLNTNFSEYS
jgi:hypothetical protein